MCLTDPLHNDSISSNTVSVQSIRHSRCFYQSYLFEFEIDIKWLTQIFITDVVLLQVEENKGFLGRRFSPFRIRSEFHTIIISLPSIFISGVKFVWHKRLIASFLFALSPLTRFLTRTTFPDVRNALSLNLGKPTRFLIQTNWCCMQSCRWPDHTGPHEDKENF